MTPAFNPSIEMEAAPSGVSVATPDPVHFDKILACLIGKSLGGIFGGPLENQKDFHDIPDNPPWPDKLLPNDDLDLQILWLEALQEYGPRLTSRDLCEIWQDRCWYNFCEYGVMLANVQRGIHPPLSGTWNNESFHASHGCPIRAEIWGVVAPGRPDIARHYATMDGRIDHGPASIDVEVFYAVMASFAMESSDINDVLEDTARFLGEETPSVQVFRSVQSIHAASTTEKMAWHRCVRAHGSRDASCVVMNHALTMLSLLVGGGDLRRTLVAAMRYGWDTDCTASTAAALLATCLGTAGVPQDWMENLPPRLICNIHIDHKEATFHQVSNEVCALIPKVLSAFPGELPAATAGEDLPPEDGIALEVRYPALPVLNRKGATPVEIVIRNDRRASVPVKLEIEPSEGLNVQIEEREVVLNAQGSASVNCWITRRESAPMLDKNLFKVTVAGDGIQEVRRTAGLAGARQWLVYGPYWNMWDREKFEVCPYNNEKITCLPADVGCATDYYNQYAFLDFAYLDEERLSQQEIPEEDPFSLETGTDLISGRQLGAMTGQCCYYLVRNFICHEPPEHAYLMLGRTGAAKVWLDGECISSNSRLYNHFLHHDEQLDVKLTSGVQRLVVKYLRQGDVTAVSPVFARLIDPREQKGKSYLIDSIEDLPARP